MDTIITDCIEYSDDGNYCLDCSEKVPDFNFKNCVAKPATFDKCLKY